MTGNPARSWSERQGADCEARGTERTISRSVGVADKPTEKQYTS